MTKKIAVGLPDDLEEVAREKVANGEYDSVEAYRTEVMQRVFAGTTLKEFLDDWFEEDGKPSPEDYAWADRQLGLSGG